MTVKVTGLPQIDKRFAALTGTKQRQYLRQGARAAGSTLIKAAKPRIPDRKRRDEKGKLGGLKRSMFQIPSSKWRNASAMRTAGVIGTRVGFRKRDGAHAHLVEFGHRIVMPRGYTRRKQGLQFVRPYPFMRPAMDSSHAAMKEAFRAKIVKGI